MADRLDLRGVGATLIGAALLVGVAFAGGFMAGQDGPLVYGSMSNVTVNMSETADPSPRGASLIPRDDASSRTTNDTSAEVGSDA